MRKVVLLSIFIGIPGLRGCLQAQHKTFADTVSVYFEELKTTTKQHIGFWNYDLYGPCMLVNPITREVFANFADSAGVLQTNGKIFTGILSKAVNISNTSVKWAGLNWAMVMLPLPQNKNNRLNLLIHELFHRVQNALGFFQYNPDNVHLDKRDGRIYLRLELEALKKAVNASPGTDSKQYIRDALAFRTFRHSIFPSSDSTENLLELNEGICEFTGVMLSGRTENEMKEHFSRRINQFIESPSYIRSFAYETVPVYGYLLSEQNKRWYKNIGNKADLTRCFQNAFGVKLRDSIRMFVASIAAKYYGDSIIREEMAREEKISKQIAAYKTILVDSPHIELPLENMNMSFDYTRIMPLENLGTVYPQIRISDNWGILEVEQGALINSNWSQVNIGFPFAIKGNQINGDGWKLELKEGYKLEKKPNEKNYVLRKQ